MLNRRHSSTMRSNSDEFVFRRKRKRLRTIDTQGNEGVVPLDQASDPWFRSVLIPDIATLPEPATSSSALPDDPEPPGPGSSLEGVVTIEKFLRCSVQTIPKTRQDVSGAVSLRRPRAYTHHHSAERRTVRSRKATRVQKRSRESYRIAKTLFRAAVLANGDPSDTLMDDAGVSHTRRPLKFVPLNKTTIPVGPGRSGPVELSDLDRREDPMLRTRRRGNVSDLKQHHYNHHTRTPLYLVPLQEAEAAYSAMFS